MIIRHDGDHHSMQVTSADLSLSQATSEKSAVIGGFYFGERHQTAHRSSAVAGVRCSVRSAPKWSKVVTALRVELHVDCFRTAKSSFPH